MIRYCITIFLSAFLLFLIQPLSARIMLPAFGSAAAVWTTSMMFFQIALLVGYLYAHGLRHYLFAGNAMLIHCVVALAAGGLLDFETLKIAMQPDVDLSLAVCLKLTLALSAAFVVISATSPLLQSWFSISHPKQNAYRLYALSNAGSVLGLIAYPLVVERIPLDWQSFVWQAMYFALAAMLVVTGWQIFASPNVEHATSPDSVTGKSSWRKTVVWMALSAAASLLLISVANILSQEVAAHPLLWVAPLAVYLISIIVCFGREHWYRRRCFQPLLTASIFASVILFHLGTNAGLAWQATGFLSLLFAGSMVCHGELYRLRPHAHKLTSFYLAMAAGGALGGMFGVLVAPRIFVGYFEFHVAVLSCLILSNVIVFANKEETPSRMVNGHFLVSMVAAAPVFCSLLFFLQPEFQPNLLFRARNGYGIISVIQEDDYRKMFNGQTNHGGQFTSPDQSQLPSAYYTMGSGIDIAFQYARFRRSPSNTSLNVGVVGLGTGSMLAYHTPGDKFTFYEINPVCESAARKYFTFIEQHDPEIVIGDGRIELQRELLHTEESSQGHGRNFDLLFLDAFSSDSIPIHLLTQEAIAMFLEHLNPEGILIFHITNRFVDLRPVLSSACDQLNCSLAMIEHHNTEFDLETRWIVASRDPELLKRKIILDNQVEFPDDLPKVQWTDQCAPISPLVDWSSNLRSVR